MELANVQGPPSQRPEISYKKIVVQLLDFSWSAVCSKSYQGILKKINNIICVQVIELTSGFSTFDRGTARNKAITYKLV